MISNSYRSILWFRIVNAFLRFAGGRETAIQIIFLIIITWGMAIHKVKHLHITALNKYKQKSFDIQELPHN